MSKRFELLGLEHEASHATRSNELSLKELRGPGNYPPDYNQVSMRLTDIDICYQFCVFAHLQADVPQTGLRRFLDLGVSVVMDYFFGEHLLTNDQSISHMRKDRNNDSIKWFGAYRDGLLLTILANNSDAEQQLIKWIEPWLPVDQSSYLVAPEDNSYHKLLAECLVHNEFKSLELLAGIKRARHQRPKLLLSCLQAFQCGDGGNLSKSLRDYLNYYLKSELSDGGISNCISIEGSILWHVAQRAGITPTGLSEKQLALIMTRETLGLE